MQKFLNMIERMFTFIAVGSVLLMVFLTTADTAGRYLLNSPIPSSYEITEKYLMVLAVFFALCISYRDGTHIRLTFVTDRLRSTKWKLAFNYVAQIVSILYNIFLVVASTKSCIAGIREFIDVTRYNLPLGPAYIIVVVGLFFMTLWMLLDLWQVKKGRSCLFKEESSKIEDTMSV